MCGLSDYSRRWHGLESLRGARHETDGRLLTRTVQPRIAVAPNTLATSLTPKEFTDGRLAGESKVGLAGGIAALPNALGVYPGTTGADPSLGRCPR